MKNKFAKTALAGFIVCQSFLLVASNPQLPLLNGPVDVSSDFHDLANFYYLADQLSGFDPDTHSGKIIYQRARYSVRHAFNNDLAIVTPANPNEFPEDQYAANPELPFSIEFVSPRALRIRMTSGPQYHPPQPELMLAGPVPHDDSWQYSKIDGGYRYASKFGSITILENPFHLEIRDAKDKLLTQTDHAQDNKTSFTPILPFSFVRRAVDYSRSFDAAFTLSPGEKIFGCMLSCLRLRLRFETEFELNPFAAKPPQKTINARFTYLPS